MRNSPDINLESFPDSPHASELRTGFARLRFSRLVESEFQGFDRARVRGRVRAWHTAALVVLLLFVAPAFLALRGDGPVVDQMKWNGAAGDPLAPLLLLANVISRLALVWLAWSPAYDRWYSRLAPFLVALCHGAWAFVCSSEIFGAHPEYLAPLVTDVFAAFFFSGLLFRSALAACLCAAAGLLCGGLYFGAAPVSVMSGFFHLMINIGMASAAGFAVERSSRSQFLERALLREMAARDGLTGLKNRRAFDEHLTRIWQQSLRDRRPLSLLLMDVDHFKAFNDHYGHQAGDEALRRIARLMNEIARRPLDLAARYGGEEFAVVLFDLAPDHVLQIAERLLRQLRELGIEHARSPNGRIITASIGIAFVRPTLERSPAGVVQLADEALYQAKHGGRDRTVLLDRDQHPISTGVFEALERSLP